MFFFLNCWEYLYLDGSLFSNLLFLFLALLLINAAPETTSSFEIASPALAFLISMGCYLIVLALIYLQNRLLKKNLHRNKSQVLFFVNLELLVFLSLYHFIFGGERLFTALPMISEWQTLPSLFSLLLYLFALGVFHYTAFDRKRFIATEETHSPFASAMEQLRLLTPFAIPFILLTFIIDLLKFFPNQDLQDVLLHNSDNAVGTLILFICTMAFMVLMMIFLPAIVQWIWLCQPIQDSALKERLERLCQKARFRHAGMLTWTIMNHSLTAAIIGIVPRFRYVMFTKRLIHDLSPEAIEAILAHEIGHSYRKHLLIYPLIILGMLVCASFFSLFFGEAISAYLSLENILSPSNLWPILSSFTIFVPYAIIIALYFRLVFGFFSRNFERQADLHVFELGIPPEFMVEALNEVGIRTGNTHHLPSWHHHSLQKRIDFINAAAQKPQMAKSHHRKVKRYVWIYAALLILASTILLAPLASNAPILGKISEWTENSSNAIANVSTHSLRKTLAENYKKQSH